MTRLDDCATDRPTAPMPAPSAAARRQVRGASVVALAAVATLVAACSRGGDAPGTANDVLPDSADQMMVGLRAALTNNGVRKAQLYADTAYFYDEGNRIDLRKVRTVFFTETGDSNATMTGRTGQLDQRTQKLDGRGDVVLESVDGRRLTSPHLVYDRIANQVTSDTSFVFTEPGRTLSGIGLRTDPQLRNVQVLKNAKGRAELKGDELSRPAGGGAPSVVGAPPPGTAPAAPAPSAPAQPAPAGTPAPQPAGTPAARPTPPPGARPGPAPLPRNPTTVPTLPPASPSGAPARPA